MKVRKKGLGILAGVLILGGICSVGAHSKYANFMSHSHTTGSAGQCAYQCSALGHGVSNYAPVNPNFGTCTCGY